VTAADKPFSVCADEARARGRSIASLLSGAKMMRLRAVVLQAARAFPARSYRIGAGACGKITAFVTSLHR